VQWIGSVFVSFGEDKRKNTAVKLMFLTVKTCMIFVIYVIFLLAWFGATGLGQCSAGFPYSFGMLPGPWMYFVCGLFFQLLTYEAAVETIQHPKKKGWCTKALSRLCGKLGS